MYFYPRYLLPPPDERPLPIRVETRALDPLWIILIIVAIAALSRR
jgi:hypothetical protein